MLTKERINEIFTEIRGEFLFAPASLGFHEKQEAPCIDRMRVMVWPEQFADDEHCRCTLRHELGHPQYAPRTLREMKSHISKMIKILGFKPEEADARLMHELGNVIYDMIVEWSLVEYHNNNLVHSWKLDSEEIFELTDGKGQSDPLWRALVGFYTVLTDFNTFNLTEDDLLIGRKALDIIEFPDILEGKVLKITELFRDIMRKENDKIEDMKKALESFLDKFRELAEKMGKAPGDKTPSTSETAGAKDKEEVKRACLDAMDMPNTLEKEEEEIVIVRVIAQGAGVEIEDIDILRIRARKRLSFKIKAPQGNLGKTMLAGYNVWSPESDAKDLDMVQTLESSGLAIPGITTLEGLKRTGSMSPVGPTFNRVWLCIDVSGSMNRNATLDAIFTLIETARFFTAECGVVLFSDKHFVINASRNYEDLQEQVVKNYGRTGCGNSTPGCNALVPLARKGDLVVFVSDFGFYNHHIQEAARILKESLPQIGAQVSVITMFTKMYVELIPDLPYAFCENIDELAGMTIETIVKKVG